MLRDGSTAEDPRLDRLPQFDERSRAYPVTATVPEEAVYKPRGYTWRCNLWLDQGREGACVGFGIAHDLHARPVEAKGIDFWYARSIYKRAQEIDPWEGEDYEGTSVLAGIKIAMRDQHYSEYRWGFGLNDLIAGVGYKGPAVLGLNWYSGMFNTNSEGFIAPTGSRTGGHCILCTAVNPKSRTFVLHNSWGQDWGNNGRALITFDHMERLLHERGEACFPVRKKVVA